jgi:SAM-dependent methyltransferase
MPDREEVEEAVRDRYATAARNASACCSVSQDFGGSSPEVYGAARYDPLDLGSGGGIDVLLSARRVGPTGRAYGVDMTDEMLELARANQRKAGVDNVEFLRGRIEDVPLPDASVDVIVSNCVINLAPDKVAVFAEAHRLLRPGGRIALADVVADAPVDDTLRADLVAWTDCIAGAVTRGEYRSILEHAGLASVTIDDSHAVADGFTSVIVRAVKPSPHRG